MQFEILVEILETTVISRHKVQFSLIDVMDKKLTFKFFTKKNCTHRFSFYSRDSSRSSWVIE